MAESFHASYIPEPSLVFGGGFPAVDPKTGLRLFGPYSPTPNRVRVGIVGDSLTVDQVKRLLEICSRGAAGPASYPLWTQDFPGATLAGALRCEFLVRDEWCRTLPQDEIDRLEDGRTLQDRIGRAVDLFHRAISALHEREDAPTVYICAPPRRMMDLCLPIEGEPGKPRGRRGRRSFAEKNFVSASARHPGQKTLAAYFDEVKEIEEEMFRRMAGDNLHHFLKARAMTIPAPTQLIRPYTLEKLFENEPGRLQDLATVCWNLAVALFYKAGGRPWRLAELPAGTCYVGISFFREKEVFGGQIGTSLAQVFTPEGEGLVLRGATFPWAVGKEPHLTADAARMILEKVLEAYHRQAETLPKRVVVHKTSHFSSEERTGMKQALAGIPRHDFVTIYEHAKGIKFFRSGEQPPLRGTSITLPDGSKLLFTRGYVPLLRVYPGARVPRPLEIYFEEIDSPKDEICREILGLTKLNWNTADFAGMLPITLAFSREVGNILREVPPTVTPMAKYLYYM